MECYKVGNRLYKTKEAAQRHLRYLLKEIDATRDLARYNRYWSIREKAEVGHIETVNMGPDVVVEKKPTRKKRKLIRKLEMED